MTDTRPALAQRPIPAMTAGPVTEEHEPVVLWVHTGAATVEVPGAAHRLGAGQAIWIPPGVQHRTQTDEGGVVVPIFPKVAELRGALAEVRVVTIPPGWDTWFVVQFDFNRFHSGGAPAHAHALVDLVLDSTRPATHSRRGAAGPPLTMPQSQEARAVAQALLRMPGSNWTTADLAAQESISVRTLQRQFRRETGVVFSEWRTRARVSVAAKHLADGRSVSWTGQQVGYDTPAGFTRAFRRHFGLTPRDHARLVDAPTRAPATADDTTAPLQALVAEDGRHPPSIPPRRWWSVVHDCHVLWWVYRGEATISIGSHRYPVQQGEAIWLPAGLSATIELAADSVLLPLGQRYGALHLAADELRAVSLPGEAEAFLLHTVLSEYTLFEPDTTQPRLADELFRQQQLDPSGGQDAGAGLTGAVAAIALALRRDPADSRSLADWAAHLGLPSRRLGAEFARQTGTSFPVWRAQLRMTLARELLRFGDPWREVSRTLGYATPAVFGKVFTTAHGISPRRYQQQVNGSGAAGD